MFRRLLWALLLLPLASPQPLPLVDFLDPIVVPDPAGDVTGQPVDAGAPGHVDLTEVLLDLDEDRLRFAIQVADTSMLTAAETVAIDIPAWVEFDAAGDRFLLAVFIEVPLDPTGDPLLEARPTLYRLDAEQWVALASFDHDNDVAAGRFAVNVPLDAIRSANGFPLAPGGVVTPQSAHSLWSESQIVYDPNRPAASSGLAVYSRVYRDDVEMPADAHLAVPEDLQGLLQAVTDLPVRYSNGGGSFRWPVQVHNPSDATVVVDVHMDHPETVDVRHPRAFPLEAGETEVIDAFAVLPFSHQHGGDVQLRLDLVAAGETTSIPLRIHFLDVAQPAGHHDMLWVHGERNEPIADLSPDSSNSQTPFMNTRQAMDRDADWMVASRALCLNDGTENAHGGGVWWIPLAPALVIGIDGRIDETAKLDFELQSDAPLPGRELHVRLMAYDGRTDQSETWSQLPDDPHALHMPLDHPGGVIALSVDVPMPPELDLIAPRPEMPNLVLAIALCEPGLPLVVVSTPLLMGQATLQLPLNEYQELLDVDGAGTAFFDVAGPLVAAAPGATVTWEPALRYASDAVGEYEIQLFGPVAGWAAWNGPETVVAGAMPEFAVSLSVPDDARDGDLLQLLLQVASVTDPADSTTLPLAVLVDSTATRDDGDLPAQPTKDAAGLPLLAVLAAVFVALRRQ